jgi:MinD-like ATPase involved in chromosome partitioning or flagellar assembly
VPLLSPVPPRYVLLVIDDAGSSIATRLRCSALDAEVVSCSCSEQAWSALTAGRRFSAVVAHRVEPELSAAAARLAVPRLAVGRRWPPGALASAVVAVATAVPRVDRAGPPDTDMVATLRAWRARSAGPGRLVAVCGPGGTGVTSVAAALAAGLGSPRPAAHRRTRVLLADLARHADQAFLHGHDDPPSGLLQLVAAGRYRPITAVDVGRHTVAAAGGRLLPGLRRPRHWTAVAPGAFDEVLSGLLAVFDLVVADITGDFEGEADGGSIDVEERNHLSRATAAAADVVVVVGSPGANGARRLAHVIDDLLDLGVDPARIQSLGERRLCGLPAPPLGMPIPIGRGGGLPARAAEPLVNAVTEMLARMPSPDRRPALVPVTPGSLGAAR